MPLHNRALPFLLVIPMTMIAVGPKIASAGEGWQGCYVGIHAGYVRADQRATDTPFAHDSFGAPITWNDPTGSTLDADSDGAMGGAQAGCDYSKPLDGMTLVLGVVGDISAIDASATGASAIAADTHTNFDANWMGNLRGRLGVANQNTLIYATGGVAFADIGVRAFDLDGTVNLGLMDVRASGTETGWVAGLGVEQRLSGNMSVSVEWLHTEFNDLVATGAAIFPTLATPRFESDLEIDTIRIGLNWRM